MARVADDWPTTFRANRLLRSAKGPPGVGFCGKELSVSERSIIFSTSVGETRCASRRSLETSSLRVGFGGLSQVGPPFQDREKTNAPHLLSRFGGPFETFGTGLPRTSEKPSNAQGFLAKQLQIRSVISKVRERKSRQLSVERQRISRTRG